MEDLFESKIFKKLYEKRLKMIKGNHPEYSPEKQRAISYVITKENSMGNGVSIYVDTDTGLIIGGEAFGD